MFMWEMEWNWRPARFTLLPNAIPSPWDAVPPTPCLFDPFFIPWVSGRPSLPPTVAYASPVMALITVRFTVLCWGEAKWKLLSCVRLFVTPMNCTVHGILQNTGVGSLSFSRGSSQPRNQTQVSRIAGSFFTSWATRYLCQTWTSNWCYYYLNFSFYLDFAIFSNQFFFSSRRQLRNNIESTAHGSVISSCLWQFLSLSSFFIILTFWGILCKVS